MSAREISKKLLGFGSVVAHGPVKLVWARLERKVMTMKKSAVIATSVLVGVGFLGTPVAAQAATVKFGAKLDSTVQPSNSIPGVYCDEEDPSQRCSFVMNEAYGRPDNGHVAPRSGVLKKIKVISGDTTSFKLQLVKSKLVGGVWQSVVKRQGPTIFVQGQDDQNWDTDNYKVETFKVNLKIKKGWRLAVVANHSPMVRCSSGGDNTLIHNPELSPGSGFISATNDDGCWLLVEGVIKY